jgi:hypothetical protein
MADISLQKTAKTANRDYGTDNKKRASVAGFGYNFLRHTIGWTW